MKWFYLLIIIISIFMFWLIMHLAKVNLKFFKKNFPAIISLIIIQLFLFLLLKNTSFIVTFLKESNNKFVEEYIIFMIITSLSVIINGIIIGMMQKIQEKKYIRKEESKYSITTFQYYRDVLEDISPAMLSYIYKLKINYDDIVVATLLYLKEKEVIVIKNNQVSWKDEKLEKKIHYDKTLSYKDTGLRNHEILIIDFATNKISFREFKNKIRKSIAIDLEKEGFIKVKEKDEFDLTEFMLLIILWIIMTLIIMLPIIFNLSKIGIFLLIAYVIAFLGIPIYERISKRINPIARTLKALNMSAKLNGLKKFLKDFSIINNQFVKHIALYEEYILYAIILDYKGKLNDECKKIYKEITKSFKNKDGFYSFSNVTKRKSRTFSLV